MKLNRQKSIFIFTLSVLFLIPQLSLAQKAFKNLYVITSDGDSLATDVYLPEGEGPFPVILLRTPYDKTHRQYGPLFNARGYAFVVQDVRGRFQSTGQFRAWIDEKMDGYETLSWIEKQPWSDGKVGFLGSSYSGYAAMQVAPQNHPALKAIVNNSGPGDMYTVIFPGGAFHNTAILPWTMAFTHNRTVNFPPYPSGLSINDLARNRPLNDGLMKSGYKGVFWNYLLNHQSKDVYWDQINLSQPESIDIPVLHVTGWYDFICTSALDSYLSIAKGQSARNMPVNQELVIGPWIHDDMINGRTRTGDVDFGENVKVGLEAHYTQAINFFDKYLKDDKGQVAENSVEFFEIGSNKWFNEKTWPETEEWDLFLSSQSGANSTAGDGRLIEKPMTATVTDEFVFDPDQPLPTLGGANIHFPFFGPIQGIKDQTALEKRDDILVYTTDPLKEDLRIFGKIKAELFVSTSARDADFTAKIVEVKPDGKANIIQEGIRRLKFAKNYRHASLVEPNTVVALEIDMGYISMRIDAGSKIRIEISGSNFPKYALNPGNGKDAMLSSEFSKARQTVYMSKDKPSKVIIPVIRD